mmetsp:Transcript_8406/g.14056  ORF Transcript_8406/g.14056 Transcript_8406/m.14056 type:complete len:166 (+) Transcript_8406:239-736(+)
MNVGSQSVELTAIYDSSALGSIVVLQECRCSDLGTIQGGNFSNDEYFYEQNLELVKITRKVEDQNYSVTYMPLYGVKQNYDSDRMGYELILNLSRNSDSFQTALYVNNAISKRSFSVYKDGDQIKMRMGTYSIPSSLPFTYSDAKYIWCESYSDHWKTKSNVDGI